MPEPIPGTNHLVLWVRGDTADGYRHWQRIGNVANTVIEHQDGLWWTPATTLRARQRIQGFFGKLLSRFRQPTGKHWFLPTGEAAEQMDERQVDVLLVWVEQGAAAVDESRIRGQWPQATRVDRLSNNLYLVSGIAPLTEAPTSEPDPITLQRDPRDAAEQMLAIARQSRDESKELAALTDLGILLTRAGSGKPALAYLEEALALAHKMGNPVLENDVIGNLGLAALVAGQPARALELLNRGLEQARATGDRFTEKAVHEKLGETYGALRDAGRSLVHYEQALALAKELGDRPHQADLLWYQAIQYAALNQRDQAVARGEAAIEVLRSLNNPQAGWLAGHLQTYRAGGDSQLRSGTQPGTPRPSSGFGSQVVGSWAPAPVGASSASQDARGPGLLTMAISSAKSMAKFLASGLKTVSPMMHQKRVRTCAACEHHTGLRCKLCGCFTNTKAWLPHENCPIGKWPAR